MDISSNKQGKSHSRRPGYGYKRETLREKLNFFKEQQKTRTNYFKAKPILRNCMANDDVMTKTKRVITL